MNKILKVILTTFLLGMLLVFSIVAKSQQNHFEIKALNNYIDFTNETIHALSLIYPELEEYNLLIKQNKNNKNVKLVFKNKNFLNASSAYWTSPVNFYRKCLNNNYLEKDSRKILNVSIENLYNITKDIQAQRDTLASYTKHQLYKTENNFNTAYKVLNNCEKLYSEFDIEKNKLYSLIIETYSQYKSVDKNNPYLKVTNNLNKLLITTKSLLNQSKANGINEKYTTLHNELFALISDLVHNKEFNLRGFPRLKETNELDPYFRYDNIIDLGNSFYQYSQDYLGKNRQNSSFEKGKDYYYYNYKFLAKYNRYGGGIVYDYNQFVSMADIQLLKMIEETPWFKASLPDDFDFNKKLVEVDIEPDSTTLKGFAANNLILLLDVSGSMNNPEKLPVMKDALKFLLTLMRPEDFISIVTYSGNVKVDLYPTSSIKATTIIDVIDNLYSSGGSNAMKGLKMSYQVAEDGFIAGGNNKVLLITDGYFKTPQRFYRNVEKYAAQDISLSVFYLNKSESKLHSEKFTKIAKLGDGNYIHVTRKNANKVLLREAQSFRR